MKNVPYKKNALWGSLIILPVFFVAIFYFFFGAKRLINLSAIASLIVAIGALYYLWQCIRPFLYEAIIYDEQKLGFAKRFSSRQYFERTKISDFSYERKAEDVMIGTVTEVDCFSFKIGNESYKFSFDSAMNRHGCLDDEKLKEFLNFMQQNTGEND